MSNISFTRYIQIVSGVGGVALAPVGSLMARLFTTSEFAPSGTVLEFSDAASVGLYFGTTSNEYKYAVFYFGWISKSIEQAEYISFAQGNTDATPPLAIGVKNTNLLGAFTGTANGSLSLTMNGVTNVLTSMDFTACLSLAAVATVLQTAIQAEAGAMWTAATVTYNTTPYAHFKITGGEDIISDISVAASGVGTDMRTLLGFTPLAIYSAGTAAKTVVDILTASTNLSNNFGSFSFIDLLSDAEMETLAEWNDAENNFFMYSVPVEPANASALSALLIGYSGAAITLWDSATDENGADGELYAMAMPSVILAATKYTRRNAAKNYQFQMFPTVTPSVYTDADANYYENLRVNFMGQTQTAGVELKFYQSGYLCGGSADALDMGVYANEQWLKRSIGTGFINMLLALDQIPANRQGIALALAILQTSIDLGLFNGTISVGKTLDTTQRAYVTTITGDPKAFYQVQSLGYWVTAIVTSYIEFGVTKYKIEYTLVYAKGDSIRKVEGTDILI